jgi:peptidyl-dipeptidase A
MQKAFLQGRGLVEADAETDEIQALLKEALDQVVYIPWSAGVMTLFERDLYEGLAPEEYNQRWWDYKLSLQGIVPPAERPSDACDPATKTHINDDAAQYYDYAISYILLHQFHSHIANEILGQDPHNTDYYGSAEVGAFLEGILRLGGTRDWRVVMEEHLGQQISAQPMLDYFAPLMPSRCQRLRIFNLVFVSVRRSSPAARYRRAGGPACHLERGPEGRVERSPKSWGLIPLPRPVWFER